MRGIWRAVLILGVLAASAAVAEDGRAASPRESIPVVGVRGLNKGGESADTRERDYDAIDRLEKIQITKPDLQQFLKEGGLR